MKKFIIATLALFAVASAAVPAGAGWWRLCGDATHGYQCGS